jgi:predicted transcriptional regulator
MNTTDFLRKRAEKSQTECAAIFDVMKRAGHGFTILEMAVAMGMPSSTVVARFHNLIEAELVEIRVDIDGNPIKRACTINGLNKKIFQIARPKKRVSTDAQTALFGGVQ